MLTLDILKRASVAVWAAEGADANYAVRLWSPGAEEIYGYTADEMIGASYIDRFVGEHDRDKAIEDHERMVRTGEVYEWNWMADDHAKDQSRRTVITNCFRVWDPELGKFLLAELGVNLESKGEAERKLRALQEEAMRQAEAERQQQTVGAFDCLNEAIAAVTGKGGGTETILGALRRAVPMALQSVDDTHVWLLDERQLPVMATDASAQRVRSLPFSVDKVALQIMTDRETSTSPIYDVYGKYLPTTVDKLAPYVRRQRRGLVRSFGIAPLASTSGLLGFFAVVFNHDRDLSVKEQSIIKSLAGHAGWALALAGYAGELQERREQEAERVRAETRELVVEAVLHTVGNDAFVLQGHVNRLLEEAAVSGIDSPLEELLEEVRLGAAQLGDVMDSLQQRTDAADKPITVRVLDDVRAVTNPLAMNVAIKVEVVVDPNLTAYATRFLLREALRNIINNAVQVMAEEDGGGRLRVSACQVEDRTGGAVVRIDVEDDGPGVPSDIKDSIWRRDVSRRSGGRGHGLAITQGLMTLLNGKVELLPSRSSLDGAHFRLTLPSSPTISS